MTRNRPVTVHLTDEELKLIDSAAAYEGSSRADAMRRGGVAHARKVRREAEQEATEPAKNGGRRP